MDVTRIIQGVRRTGMGDGSGWLLAVLRHRITALAVNVLVLILVAWSLAQWTWRALSPAPATPAAISLTGRYDLNLLQSAGLFGGSGTAVRAPLDPSVIPLTSLNLVVSGIVLRGTGSYAVISLDGAPETPVRVGASLSAGVSLEQIQPGRIIIRRGGALEAAELKELATSLPPGALTQGANRPVVLSAPGSGMVAVDRDALQQQLQRPEFLRQALITPSPDGGFVVREMQPGSVYEKLGLKVGDVIKTVNGQSVGTLEEVMRLYQQLGQSGQVTVEVTRLGRPEILHYDLR